MIIGRGDNCGLGAHTGLHHWDSGPALLLRYEYLAAENRILKAQLKTPLRLTDAERVTLAEIAHRLGRKALEDVANAAKPVTLLGWYRKLVARKFDGSRCAWRITSHAAIKVRRSFRMYIFRANYGLEAWSSAVSLLILEDLI